MRYRLLLPITALTLSCSFVTGLGSSSSSAVPVDLDSPADPVNVVVELNEDETTSSVISPEGGELALVGADGSVYRLEVPAGALLADTEVSMTVIGSLAGGPVEGNVYGVQLEPSGLAFYEFLTLTIQPAAEIPLEEQFMFKYEGDGENLHHAIVAPNTGEIRIRLLSFSGAGAGYITRTSEKLGQLQSAQLRVDNAYGRLFQEFRKGTPAQQAAMTSAIYGLLEAQRKQVDLLISAAKEDCQNLEQALEARRILDKYRDELQEEILGSGMSPLNDEQLAELAQLREKCRRPYNLQGMSGDFRIDQNICNIYGPITILAQSTASSCVSAESFIPVAGSLSGTYSYALRGCPFGVSGGGSGTYSIQLSPGGGTLTARLKSTIEGQSEDITMMLKLTALEPGTPCQ